MLDNENNEKEYQTNNIDKFIDILKKDDIYEVLEENDLRSAFTKLDMEDKVLVLYETILSNRGKIVSNKERIADGEHRLALFEKTQKISVSTWFKKVLIIFLAFTGSVALLTFVFMIVKNGAFNDISVVASFFKTMNEVMNVIFLTK